ncbi:hypothetical protein GY45DRAFT_174954 [Cubamyces sp. BRFM 1775]|nr:hypothetical protein GY45DRAFT_174954 [Cubamyces sp. BRFM 1775]
MLAVRRRVRERDESPPVNLKIVILDKLPLEVLDLIFKHASDDKPTILACSLASRHWRDMSLPHLFFSLKVERTFDYDDFSDFLAEHPNLANYVRRLVLGYLPKHFSGLLHTTIRPTLTPAKLSKLAAKLPRLQALVLRGVWLAEAQEVDSTSLPSITPRGLKELIIDGCGSGVRRDLPLPLRTLFRILLACPANAVTLRSLFVANCDALALVQFDTQPSSESSASHQPTTKLDVSSLEVKSLSCDDWPRHRDAWELEMRLYDAFRHILAPQCLRSLRIHPTVHGHAPDALRALGALIEHVGGEALRHLELPFSIRANTAVLAESRPDYWRILHLDKCRNLESIHITMTFPWPGTHSAKQPPQVPYTTVCIALFAQLPSTLRIATLELRSPDEARILDAEWLNLRELDEALLAHFPSLEMVHMILHGQVRWVECTRLIRNAMAKCRQRGVLYVGSTSDESTF